jgi:hypothetical protein
VQPSSASQRRKANRSEVTQRNVRISLQPLSRFDHTQAGDHKTLLHSEPTAAGIQDFHPLGSCAGHGATQAALAESEPGVWGDSSSSAGAKGTKGWCVQTPGNIFLDTLGHSKRCAVLTASLFLPSVSPVFIRGGAPSAHDLFPGTPPRAPAPACARSFLGLGSPYPHQLAPGLRTATAHIAPLRSLRLSTGGQG